LKDEDGEDEEEMKEDVRETESVFSYQSGVTGISAVTYATDQLGITVLFIIITNSYHL
jgi:hypothetical protein